MRKGIIVSAALHMGVIGATMVTWPAAFSQSEEALPIVPVELITLADVTNVRAVVREEAPPEPRPPEPEPPVAVPEPEPVIVEAEPEPEPLPVLEPEPEPEPVIVAEAEPEPEPPPPPPPPPREKPAPQREEFNLDSVIAMLDSRAPAAPAQPAEQTRRGIGDNSAMTMTLVDLIRTQMYECWSPPIGAPRPEELIVEVNVYLAPNGGLARAPQLTAASRAAAAANPYMRAAAESALRAVNICAPYRNLPTDQYGRWNEVKIIFDPTKMAGR